MPIGDFLKRTAREFGTPGILAAEQQAEQEAEFARQELEKQILGNIALDPNQSQADRQKALSGLRKMGINLPELGLGGAPQPAGARIISGDSDIGKALGIPPGENAEVQGLRRTAEGGFEADDINRFGSSQNIDINVGPKASLSETERRQLNDQETATRNFIDTSSDALSLLQANPDINTFIAKAASTVNNLQQEGRAIAKAFGMEFDESIFDPSTYKNEFDELGVQNVRMQSLIVALSFQAAAAQGQTGRAISDRDVTRFVREIGASSADPRAFSRTLIDVANRSARSFRNSFQSRTGTTFNGDLGLSRLNFNEEQPQTTSPENRFEGFSIAK